MFLSYQPGELKPVALQQDTLAPCDEYSYIRLVFGIVVLPVANVGFSFGDGRSTFVNVFANQLSSHGNLDNQKSSLTDVKIDATFKTATNLEWNGSLGFKNDEY